MSLKPLDFDEMSTEWDTVCRGNSRKMNSGMPVSLCSNLKSFFEDWRRVSLKCFGPERTEWESSFQTLKEPWVDTLWTCSTDACEPVNRSQTVQYVKRWRFILLNTATTLLFSLVFIQTPKEAVGWILNLSRASQGYISPQNQKKDILIYYTCTLPFKFCCFFTKFYSARMH